MRKSITLGLRGRLEENITRFALSASACPGRNSSSGNSSLPEWSQKSRCLPAVCPALTVIGALVVSTLGPQTARALPISGSVNVVTWTVNAGAAGGADPNIGQDFQYMNQIYSQVGITFNDQQNKVLNNTPSPGAIWTVNDLEGTGNLMDNNNVGGGVANPVNLYYLPSFDSFGEAWSARRIGDTQSGQTITHQGAVVTFMNAVAGTPAGNAGPRRVDTVAHELGHILLNNWAFRSAEGNPAGTSGGGHAGPYVQATSPYIPNNTGVQDLMAAGGAPRTIPGALNQVAPVGNLDQINLNIGINNRGGSGYRPNVNAVLPQISAMYNDSQTVQNINRDMITATVGNTTSAAFGWGLTQTISGVSVNEAARTSSFVTGTRTDDILLEYRSSGVFVQGGGLKLGIGDLSSLSGYDYTAFTANSLKVITVDNILTNAATFTTLTPDTDYTSTVNFNSATHTLDGLNVTFENLPSGLQDILIEFQLQSVPEPSTLALALAGVAFLGMVNRRKRRTAA